MVFNYSSKITKGFVVRMFNFLRVLHCVRDTAASASVKSCHLAGEIGLAVVAAGNSTTFSLPLLLLSYVCLHRLK